MDIGARMGRTKQSVLKAMQRHDITSSATRSLSPDNPREIERRKKVGHPGASHPRYVDGGGSKASQTRIAAALQREIRTLLGGRCSVPGCENGDLQIDHVNGDGQDHRRQTNRATGYYRSILDDISTGRREYQLLCQPHHRDKTWGPSRI